MTSLIFFQLLFSFIILHLHLHHLAFLVIIIVTIHAYVIPEQNFSTLLMIIRIRLIWEFCINYYKIDFMRLIIWKVLLLFFLDFKTLYEK